jgi:hypothetical protein
VVLRFVDAERDAHRVAEDLGVVDDDAIVRGLIGELAARAEASASATMANAAAVDAVLMASR